MCWGNLTHVVSQERCEPDGARCSLFVRHLQSVAHQGYSHLAKMAMEGHPKQTNRCYECESVRLEPLEIGRTIMCAGWAEPVIFSLMVDDSPCTCRIDPVTNLLTGRSWFGCSSPCSSHSMSTLIQETTWTENSAIRSCLCERETHVEPLREERLQNCMLETTESRELRGGVVQPFLFYPFELLWSSCSYLRSVQRLPTRELQQQAVSMCSSKVWFEHVKSR